MGNLHDWKISFPTPDSHGGRVLIDGRVVKGVRAVSVKAELLHPVILTLTVYPGSLEVEGVGQPIFTTKETRPDSFWQKAKHALAI